MLGSLLRVCATVYLSIIVSVTYLSFTLVKPNVKESSAEVKIFNMLDTHTHNGSVISSGSVYGNLNGLLK